MKIFTYWVIFGGKQLNSTQLDILIKIHLFVIVIIIRHYVLYIIKHKIILSDTKFSHK